MALAKQRTERTRTSEIVASLHAAIADSPFTGQLEKILPETPATRIVATAGTFEQCLLAQGIPPLDAESLALEVSAGLSLGQIVTLQGSNSTLLASILSDNWEAEPVLLRAGMGPFQAMSALTEALDSPQDSSCLVLDEVSTFLDDSRFQTLFACLEQRSIAFHLEQPPIAILASSVNRHPASRLLSLGPLFSTEHLSVYPASLTDGLPLIQDRWIPLTDYDLEPLDEIGEALLAPFSHQDHEEFLKLASRAYRLLSTLSQTLEKPLNPVTSLAAGWVIPAFTLWNMSFDSSIRVIEESLMGKIESERRLRHLLPGP